MTADRVKPPRISASLLAVLGAVFLVGGVWLLALGGAFYYAAAGVGLMASAILLWKGRRLALWVYAVVWLATVVWAVAESGLNFWLLEPKVLAPTILGLWLFSPWVTRRLEEGRNRALLVTPAVGLVMVLALGIVAWMQPVGVTGAFAGQTRLTPSDPLTADADWAFYGRTARGERFSPLSQITPQNVSALKLAWSARTGDTMRPGEDQGGTDAGHEFNFENTPIKVADTLYVCTGHSWVEAIDAATGKIKWKFDPKANTDPNVYLACRGVAYYEAPGGVSTPCPHRIIAPVLDARLVALNAETGAVCPDFGKGGFVSLTQYLGHVPAGFHFVTSPPLVINNRVILFGPGILAAPKASRRSSPAPMMC